MGFTLVYCRFCFFLCVFLCVFLTVTSLFVLGLVVLCFCVLFVFLRASAMLKHVIDIGWTSVRPSVCHTLAPYQNG